MRNKTTVQIPLGYCANGTDFDTSNTNSPLTLMCYDDVSVKHLSIGGDFFGGSFDSFKLAVFACVPSPTQQCANSTTITSYFATNPTL